MSSQAALTTNKSFKSLYPQIIITKLQSKFKFDRNLPNGVKCTVLSSHKFSLGLTFMVICIKKEKRKKEKRNS